MFPLLIWWKPRHYDILTDNVVKGWCAFTWNITVEVRGARAHGVQLRLDWGWVVVAADPIWL